MPADPQVTLDLLARHMFIADELRKAGDEIAGIQAAEEWDGDRLLTDTYERFGTIAREAVAAEISRLREEANSDDGE